MKALLDEGYTKEGLLAGLEDATNYYFKYFTVEDTELNQPKTPDRLVNGAMEYIEKYKFDDFEIIHTEIAGTVPISPTRVIHFRLDANCQDKRGPFILDHKTCSRMGPTWEDQWTLSIQMSTYLHAAAALLENPKNLRLVVNGACFRMKDTEFKRVSTKRSAGMMLSYLHQINAVFDNIERDMEALDKCSPEAPVMECFTCNPTHCEFRRCAFKDFCAIWPNPLAHAHSVPFGFKVEFWDPRSLREHAKEVVKL